MVEGIQTVFITVARAEYTRLIGDETRYKNMVNNIIISKWVIEIGKKRIKSQRYLVVGLRLIVSMTGGSTLFA